MIKKIIPFVILLLAAHFIIAQTYDQGWVVGAGNTLVRLTFNGSTIDTSSYYWGDTVIEVSGAVSNVSDTSGNILFLCNGTQIASNLDHIMENGDSLMDDLIYTAFNDDWGEPYSNIILPRSGNTFYVFNFSESDFLYSNGIYEPDKLYYSIVDMDANGGSGKVLSKKNLASQSTGVYGECRLTACRHANGRDWWLVHQGFGNNEYYIYLITPDSVSAPKVQKIGPASAQDDNLGAEACFSPDGSKFVTGTVDGPLVIMDFDRCGGVFFNPDTIYIPYDTFPYKGINNVVFGGATGCCFSPSGRFVYATDDFKIFQYDTWASNVAQSMVMVGIWDSTDTSSQFLAFYSMALMPNGQIIIDDLQGGGVKFHLIDSPDVKGLGCHFVYKGLSTNTWSSNGIPNMINYRLGSLTGSSCDTLTGIAEIKEQQKDFVTIEPNPASSIFTVVLSNTNSTEYKDLSFTLYDLTGRLVMHEPLSDRSTSLHRTDQPDGIYLWHISADNKNLYNGKLVLR